MKLALVLALSGVQGIQSGRLRRRAQGGAVRPARLVPAVLTAAGLIALLAIARPF